MKKQMLLLGIALIILLTGCTGKSGSVKRKKIEYMYSGGIANTKIMEVVKQAFEAENPEYELYLNFVPNWSAFRTKVKMTVAAGMPPDIIVDTPGVISDFYERNVLYDLTDFINQDPIFQSIKKDISPPELLDVGKIKGRYWSLPAWQNPTVIFYNKRLFKESGVPFPDDDWTFEEFTEAIKKLTKQQRRSTKAKSGSYILVDCEPNWPKKDTGTYRNYLITQYAALAFHSAMQSEIAVDEIGRASCRERV